MTTKNLSLGLIVLLAGAFYIMEAQQLPDSSLSDTVGADAFPLAIGWGLVGLAAILIAQSLVPWLREKAAGDGVDGAATVWADPVHATRRAAGLFAIALAFLIILPFAGYLLSVGLLIGACALYLGKPMGRQVSLTAIGGALGLYVLFVLILDIPFPSGFPGRLM